jgi:hypothetical protein
LFQANLPKQFWSYAVSHAVYLINRIPSPVLNNKSPYFLVHQKLPDLTHLRIFGTLVYAITLQNQRTKLASRARKSIFLGYRPGVKGVVLFDINNRDIFVSRNVTHHENIFPYQNKHQTSPWSYYPSTASPFFSPPSTSIDSTPTTLVPSSTSTTNNTPNLAPSTINYDTTIDDPNSCFVDHSTINAPHTQPVLSTNHSIPLQTTSLDPSSSTSDTNTAPVPLPPTTSPRPQRLRHAPAHLKDYVCNSSTDSHAPISSGTTHPISLFHSFHHLSPSHKAFSVSLSLTTEPKTYDEACKS